MNFPRFRSALVLMLGMSLVNPPTAYAAYLPTTFTVTGSGWGHGLGLSQYGAQGMALEGYQADQIISNYFPGTSYADFDTVTGTGVNAGLIRASLDNDATYILLRGEDNPVDGGVTEPLHISVDGATPIDVPVGTTLAVTQSGTKFSITGTGVNITNAGGARVTWNNTTTLLAVNSGDPRNSESVILGNCVAGSSCPNRYKYGFVDLFVSNAGADSVQDLHAVNTLRVNDEYLYGLGEVPSSWSKEALKAQTVAARSYAIYKMLNNPNSTTVDDCQCQIYTTSTHQVFSGFNKEVSSYGASWVAAVNETVSGNTGKVVTANGSVISTYYSSSTGGRSQAAHEVWGGSPVSYLLGSDDRWSLNANTGNPNISWTVTIDQATLAARLKAQDSRVTDVAALSFATYASGGVSQLTVTNSSGSALTINVGPSGPITPAELKTMFSAKSTYFTAITASPDPSPTPTSSATPTPTPTPTLTPTPTPTVVAPAPAAPAPVPPAPVAANVPTASVKVKSVTSVKWPSAKIKPGSTSVTGRVIPAQTGIAVSLQVLRSGTWATVATDTTGAKGVWKTSWNDVNAGSYKMRIVAASKLNSVVTSSRTLTAVGAVTILGPGKVNRNSTISIRGAVSPGLSGIQVTIQRRIGSGSWRNVGTVSTNSSGAWSATLPAGANKTSNQFRVTTSDGRIGQSTSKTLTTSIR